jgi:hypothetical protein
LHLHIAQVPPPPQAEGRKRLREASAESRVLPGWVIKGLSASPFTIILTSPVGSNFIRAKMSIKDSSRIVSTKTATEDKIKV